MQCKFNNCKNIAKKDKQYCTPHLKSKPKSIDIDDFSICPICLINKRHIWNNETMPHCKYCWKDNQIKTNPNFQPIIKNIKVNGNKKKKRKKRRVQSDSEFSNKKVINKINEDPFIKIPLDKQENKRIDNILKDF